MNRPRPKGRPTFFWQPVFILLPVVGLACFGLYSMRQDRLLAEREAHDSGQVLAQELVHAVKIKISEEWSAYKQANSTFNTKRITDLGLATWGNTDQEKATALEHMNAWQRENPQFDLTSLPPVEGYLNYKPAPLEPQPPEWVSQLNTDQRRLWESAQESLLVTRDYPAAQSALDEFMASKPPAGARANAEYLLMLTNMPSNGVALDRFSVETATDRSLGRYYFPTELTEAGLPIGQLTCFQALRRGSGVRQGVGIPKIWLRTIACEINDRPSIFSPRLISEAERVAKGTPSETNVAMLRAWWEANQIRREVLDNFRDQHPTNGWNNGPFWVSSITSKFLVELNDDVIWPSNTYRPGDWHYNITPRSVIASGLADRIRKSGVSVPPYALAKFDVVGEKITIPQEPPTPTVSRAMPVLGEADATWEWRILGSSGNSRYPFHIQVLLASPDILYARQSQRTLLFSALILASAFAAMIGLFSAYSSFRRQLRLNELKSDFVSSVSHELRAPIASVRLMAEGLERGKISEPAKQHEYFKFIVQECRRLSSLIENVLDFSRIEEGRKRYEMESTDLAALTQQTVKVMETYAAEREINIALRVTGTAAPVDLDGKAMQRALVNLIDNAIKHSPKGSTIAVDLDFNHCPAAADTARHPQPSSVLLSVEDHGEGIAASEQDKIFERFYRIGSELRRETQGVGIGLSIVKHIVEAHGGTVTVRSAPGQGSRFTIQLPAGNGTGVCE